MSTKDEKREHDDKPPHAPPPPTTHPQPGAGVASINEASVPRDVGTDTPYSINEPPGSDVIPSGAAVKDPPEASHTVTKDVSHETSGEPLPDLDGMTRAELDALAKERGVDTSHAHNKDDVIAAIRKDARKRK
jgi:hypothetical protein